MNSVVFLDIQSFIIIETNLRFQLSSGFCQLWEAGDEMHQENKMRISNRKQRLWLLEQIYFIHPTAVTVKEH